MKSRNFIGHGIIIGGQDLCRTPDEIGMSVIHACKRPCFDKSWEHHPPETMIAKYVRRDDRELWLNMIDHPTLPLFDLSLFTYAHAFMKDQIEKGRQVLVHCNQGKSRSASIAMTYLLRSGLWEMHELSDAVPKFAELYPAIAISGGLYRFLQENWEAICHDPL